MNVSKVDITLATALTGLVIGGLLMAGMASAIVLGTAIAAVIIIDNKTQFTA